MLDVAVADASDVTNEGGVTTVTYALPTAVAAAEYVGQHSLHNSSVDVVDIFILYI
jgi:hypothetical protein